MWAARCMHEAQLHEDNCFITLTYDDDHLPADQSLNKTHFQSFMKALRREIGHKKIKYYHCGEYGEKTSRPHYHACIFGYDFPDRKLWKVSNDIPIDTSAILGRLWKKGFTSVGNLSFDSAAYVARYCLKKINGNLREKPNEKTGLTPYERVHLQTGEIIEVEPEYATMSRRPGIGRDWFERYRSDVYPSDNIIVKGYEQRPPRYYDSLFEIIDPESMENIKTAREQNFRKFRADNTPQRLEAREKVKKAQVGLLKREI